MDSDNLTHTKPLSTQTTSSTSSTITYSNAVTNFNFPTKQQAVVLSSVPDIKIHEYITAIGTIVQPKNIIFASRISNNRVCIYLSNTTIVENLLHNHKSVSIQGNDIEIRRLITPASRLVISGVCPSIPNTIIEEELKKLELTAVSKITFLKVGMPESEYSHILSFSLSQIHF
ncbi:uncharacterized protein LOC126885238 [Diabrotica virgifera virgifera]|uniref:Uncharacterized protein n=1 Tax=Diabrotica virgifera virgifera TaxID=50390 RepID=A0ABM5KBU6_DIAVI|nr:uncharacterized protein LOC126885238 [Diabrotica virgifera virgifera]